MNLAKAKSEALKNLNSLLKQNIKSCYAEQGRQREWWENSNRSNKPKKKTILHVQHTFFVCFFTVVLHDHNVKLPETC